MVTAISRRISERLGEMTAICSSPVVVSTSPVSRERMPPVFMSHSFGSGRWSRRSKSDLRSDSITRDVQQPLAVVFPHAKAVRDEDDPDENRPRHVKPCDTFGSAQAGVEQDAIDDESHEERLDHLEAGREQREQKEEGDGKSMRPQPADVLAEVLPTFAAGRPRRLRGTGDLWFRGVVQAPFPERRDEVPIERAREAGEAHGRARSF